MTTNQLAYWKNQEDIRANKAREGLTQAQNVLKEREIAEKERANRVTESVAKRELQRKRDRDAWDVITNANSSWNGTAKNFISLISPLFGMK